MLLIRCGHTGGILSLTHPVAANESAADLQNKRDTRETDVLLVTSTGPKQGKCRECFFVRVLRFSFTSELFTFPSVRLWIRAESHCEVLTEWTVLFLPLIHSDVSFLFVTLSVLLEEILRPAPSQQPAAVRCSSQEFWCFGSLGLGLFTLEKMF